MENASKALLIAGAILISILLISVGIMTIGSTSGLTEQTHAVARTEEIRLSNSQLSKYFGERVTGAQVISFLSYVIIHNSQNENPILINFNNKHHSTSNEIQAVINGIDRSAYYIIRVTNECNTYNGGYRTNGSFGCLTVEKL